MLDRTLLEETSSNKTAFKSLSMAILIKSKFVSSAITAFSHKKVSEITGLSPKTVAKYVHICLEKKWAYTLPDGRLIFTQVHNTSNKSCKKSARVFLRGHETVKQVSDKLYAAIMEYSYNYREMKSIRRKNAVDILRKQEAGAYKAARFLKKQDRNETNSSRTISGMPFSIIAKNFKCSVTTAQKWVRRMEEEKLLVKTRHIDIVYSGKDAASYYASIVESTKSSQGYWARDCRDKDNIKMVLIPMDNFQRLCLNRKHDAVLLITPNTYQFNTEEMLVGPYSPKCELDKRYTPCHNVTVNGKLIKTKSKLKQYDVAISATSTVDRRFDLGGLEVEKAFYNETRVIR